MLYAKKISFLDEYVHIKHFRNDFSVEELLIHTMQNSYLILDLFLQNRKLYDYYKRQLLNYIFVQLLDICKNLDFNLKSSYLNKIKEVFRNFCYDYNLEDDILTNVNSGIIDTLNDDEKANVDNINPKVSIIVPVYNTDKYITKCMDSILNQTFKNIEIICINDGSTDDSLRILRDYEKNIHL